MSVQSIQTIIKELQKETTILVRQPVSFSWCKNISEAGELLETIFKEVDKTVEYFQWLEEYYHIKSWMMNTEGKGLLLMGSCGRGKSVIASGVIPVLFRMKGKYLRPVHAQDMTKPTPQQPYLAYGQRPETWLDYLQRCAFPIIDSAVLRFRARLRKQKRTASAAVLGCCREGFRCVAADYQSKPANSTSFLARARRSALVMLPRCSRTPAALPWRAAMMALR